VHGKTSRIRCQNQGDLFSNMPEIFEAMRYHSLIAAEEGLPEDLIVTARELDDGLIMGVQHKSDPLYGVQFHPESIGTPDGTRILENFIKQC
jgi:anthranilate/para-aminobenzoate synthase component II